MGKKTVRDIDLRGKRVLLRVDFNVPLNSETSSIADDSRIRVVLPTIEYLLENRARVILCSHLGRPRGEPREELRMAPVAKRLSQLLSLPVATAPDCIGPEVEDLVSELGEGEVLMLENLRFHPQEEKNDPDFARALAGLAEVYVNDAFGTAHRAHASTEGVAHYLPAVAGFLLEKEVEVMGRALNNPPRPFAALVGGAKISDKIAVLEHLLERVDSLLLGGGMVATFLKAQHREVGRSLVEDDRLDLATALMEKSKKRGVTFILPVDVVIAREFSADAPSRRVSIEEIPPDWYIMDIGEETIALFEKELRKCRTIVWNGPMGVFEFPAFAGGTRAMANLLADLEATTIVGGGSTAEAVVEMGLEGRMTHVSTGGGASLDFLGGKTLPGVAALMDR